VLRPEELNAVRVVVKVNVERKIGRPKKRWLETIENDMRTVGVLYRKSRRVEV
jgi:hypothetical protein